MRWEGGWDEKGDDERRRGDGMRWEGDERRRGEGMRWDEKGDERTRGKGMGWDEKGEERRGREEGWMKIVHSHSPFLSLLYLTYKHRIHNFLFLEEQTMHISVMRNSLQALQVHKNYVPTSENREYWGILDFS